MYASWTHGSYPSQAIEACTEAELKFVIIDWVQKLKQPLELDA